MYRITGACYLGRAASGTPGRFHDPARTHAKPRVRRRLFALSAMAEVLALRPDHLEPARNLAIGVGEDLAVLERQEAREVVVVVVDELADAEEDLGAARERERAPPREGALRSPDGRVDLLDRGEVDLAGLDASCRVQDGAAAARPALYALPSIRCEIRITSPLRSSVNWSATSVMPASFVRAPA